MKNKKNGIYYTPPALADYLVKPLIKTKDQSILDPSYGEGSLLLAAERAIKHKWKNPYFHLFGCDILPVNGLLRHIPEANLKQIDFFCFSTDNTFHTIIMNPPYVRHQIQESSNIEKYRSSYPILKILKNTADLWAYFLVKAVLHLKKGGNIGAILPWAVLQADYAKPLRTWLSEIFNEIIVVTLSNKYFKKANERVVILWLKGYGRKCKSIKIASSKNIESTITFTELPIHNWTSNRVFYSSFYNIEQILNRYKSEFGFTEFSLHADVKIGVVTGAVDYFIMSKKETKKIGISRNRLIPILTSSDEFAEYLKIGKKNLSLLASLKAKDHLKYRNFIKKGIESKVNLRSHSLLREPWYSVKVGNVPDAFFHYRITKIPYLLPNHDKVQCTNSIHRIYFKNVTEIEKKWIIVSMLSIPSQLSIEINAKTYGRGILKIEPKSLKNALVIKRCDPIVNSTYEKIISLLSANKKESAMYAASEFIYNELGISEDLIHCTEEILGKYQDLRITKR
jgi:adenine-specific DNA-methyltransferase